MSNQYDRESTREIRYSMQNRGPGRPAVFEKAKNTNRALMRLLPYLKPYKLSMSLVLGIVIIYTLLGLVGPYLMGGAIDRFIGAKDASGLPLIALLMLGAYLFNNLFTAWSNWIMARISQQALKQIRRDLFTHIQTLSLSYFDRNQAGGLMSRLTNDIDAINQAVSQNVTSLFASALSMVGILITMFVLNHWLALATLLVVPIMTWFANFVAK